MEENITFDQDKFDDVVHLVVDHVQQKFGKTALGNVKLHKILYYADFLCYLSTMRPLTGADYQRQKFGPTARKLSVALSRLAAAGRLTVASVPFYGFAKKEYWSLTAPKTNRLSDTDHALILDVCAFVCGQTANEISDFSHDEVWSSVELGERIPYYAAHALFPVELTEEDIADAMVEAARLVPLFEARPAHAG